LSDKSSLFFQKIVPVGATNVFTVLQGAVKQNNYVHVFLGTV